MFDFAWSELALIAVVALIVIGPKDLPRAMRVAGFWVRKARTVAREFQGSIEEMVRESELDEVRREVEKASRLSIADAIDPDGQIKSALSDPVLANPMADRPSLPEPIPEAPRPEALPAPSPEPAPRHEDSGAPSHTPEPTHNP